MFPVFDKRKTGIHLRKLWMKKFVRKRCTAVSGIGECTMDVNLVHTLKRFSLKVLKS